MKDSINVVNEMAQHSNIYLQNKVWLFVAFITAIMIITAVILYINGNKKRKLKKKIIEETASVDFTGSTHDWEKSKLLYDVLKKKCHPDKFGNELNDEATRIFQLANKNRYNYQELVKIKQEAIDKLGIEIDEL